MTRPETQKILIDADDSIVVTRGKGGILKGQGGQVYGDERRFDFGGEHPVQCTDDIS